MAAVTTKRSKASAVKQASIKDTNAFLQSLPDKPKEDLSLREAVEQMRDSVRGALAKGYTYQELAAMLTDQGIRISAFTLKNYVPSGRRRSTKEQPPKATPRKGRKANVETEEEVAKPATITPIEPAAPSSEPAAKTAATTPRGRAKATTAAKAKSGGGATVKQSATKQSRTAAKPTSKTTRGRKKA